MAAWRTLGSVVVLLGVAQAGWTQTYPLAEVVKAGDCVRIHLDMNLTGEIRVSRDGKVYPLKLTATATHDFPERILSVGSAGLPEKTARYYESAKATITAGRDVSERKLRAERRLVVSQRYKDQPLVYCPDGPFTREELELTSEHFDTLALTGLLPGKAVAIGESWKVSNVIAQALCNFEGLTEQDLVCKLEEAKDNLARVSVKGSASGIDLGAMVKVTIDGGYQFDLGAKRLTALAWKQKDEREQGPASPATAVENTTILKRTAIEEPESLNPVKLVSIPEDATPAPPVVRLLHRDPKDRFDLVYAREWQTVGQTDDHLVMRLMERGDFVAQVTITPWTAAKKGEHLTPDEFHEAMDETPGWEPKSELQAGEVPTDDKRWIYRLSALGTMDGVEVMQNFYLIAGPEGEQVVLAFTLSPKQAERLGDRDLSLAGSLTFPPASKP
jgi:hypothetical protein